ncbi:MAG: ABC transporter permease [Caldilineaceae bacterium]
MAQASTVQSKYKSERRNRFWDTVLRFQSYFGLIAILVLSTLVSPVRDGRNIFLDPNNLLNIVRFASENGIIAIGMTLVILIGGIDLSVGAVMALCAVGAASFMMRDGLGTLPTVVLVLSIGALAGMTNGLVTTRFNIQSFIVTLAMLSIARGLASLWSGGYAIPLAFGMEAGLAPQSFKNLFAGSITIGSINIPVQIFYFLGVGLIASLALKRTAFGRHVYAVGGNETASRLSGVNVNRVKTIVFTVSGLLAGLAALLHAALVNQGSHIDGSGYELNAIAAVVIGGTSLAGGVGTVVGSMVGAVILSILDNILGLRNIPSEYQMILKGVLIVGAVLVQRRKR